jgi:hypothetical protein
VYKRPLKIKFAISIQVETEVVNIYATAVNVKFIQSQIVACGRKNVAKTFSQIKYIILELQVYALETIQKVLCRNNNISGMHCSSFHPLAARGTACERDLQQAKQAENINKYSS